MELPYLPEGKTILYVGVNHPFMEEARFMAEEFSLDAAHKTGAIIVKEGQILGGGANGSALHKTNGCERKKQNIPTGEGYDICHGCHPENHAEQKAIAFVLESSLLPKGADLYLWGHWWCCESCWNVMINAGIENVYLPEGAADLFKK